jgi:hypothetical protein
MHDSNRRAWVVERLLAGTCVELVAPNARRHGSSRLQESVHHFAMTSNVLCVVSLHSQLSLQAANYNTTVHVLLLALQCGWTAPSTSSSQGATAAPAAAAVGEASLAADSNPMSSIISGKPTAVTVRLLSAEDAFLPVMDAAAQRCIAFAVQGGSPRAAAAATASKSRQQQQQCEAGALTQQPAVGASGSCTCSQQQAGSTPGIPCTSCQQLQQQQQQQKVDGCNSTQPNLPQKQQGSMLPELAAVTGSSDITEEPQLLLVYGPVLTLAGYPPFHMRSAEVQHMGPLTQANQRGVADAIAAYCKVLQRHGA